MWSGGGVDIEKMDERLMAGEGEERAKRRDLAPLTFDRLTLFPSGSTRCLSSASQAEKMMMRYFICFLMAVVRLLVFPVCGA